MDDKDEINLNGFQDWYNKLLDNSIDKSTQFDLFYDNKNQISLGSAGTISHAVGSNIYPYVSTGTGNYTLTTGTGTGNISPGLGLSFNDYWDNSSSKAGLHVKGDAEFEGDVKIKGKSISELLDKIEERLAILHPNEKLEEKWEELKKLGDAYRALEKDIIEKEKIWETLKK
ncbi:hypothetical protein EBU71_22200 [bacterium]|nr:hypothetical protein [Candidatus Elulimicrobium humile]